jgi:hypothetical protein
MSFHLRVTLCFVANAFFFQKSFSQIDSAFLAEVKKNTIARHDHALTAQLPIYRGRIYVPSFVADKKGQHSYFGIGTMVKGAVTYEGVFYKDVYLKYNLVSDELILQHYDKATNFVLDRDRVDWFSVGDQKFVNLRNDSSYNELIPNGFFNLLYDGNTKLLAKRQKTITEVRNFESMERRVESKSQYYIVKRTEYYEIKNKKTLLRVLKKNGNESQQYLNSNKLSFKKDPEGTILSLIKFFDN